jgi:hypothetical protein
MIGGGLRSLSAITGPHGIPCIQIRLLSSSRSRWYCTSASSHWSFFTAPGTNLQTPRSGGAIIYVYVFTCGGGDDELCGARRS